MGKDIPTPADLRGIALREEIKTSLQTSIDSLRSVKRPGQKLMPTFLRRFDELGIDWSTPRTTGQVQQFSNSFGVAFSYAFIKTGKKREFDEYLASDNTNLWNNAIDRVLADDEMRTIFHENVWRPVTTAVIERGIPLQYILRHQFGNRPIRGIDIGTGIGIALPLLNSTRYTDAEFEGRNQIREFAQPINITLGIGIDKQDNRDDMNWVVAANFAPKPNDLTLSEMTALTKNNPTQFPFLLVDVLDEEQTHAALQHLLGDDHTVDFIISSFSRYQLGGEQQQQIFINSVTSLLPEWGIWIDIGDELLRRDQNGAETPSVKVYEKRNGQLILKGQPFVLKFQGRGIHSVDTSYFLTSSHQE